MFFEGQAVEVSHKFMSKCKMTLPAGIVGTIKRFDCQGDALIGFQSLSKEVWVNASRMEDNMYAVNIKNDAEYYGLRMRKLYTRYCPDKVDTIEPLLTKYPGMGKIIYNKACQQFGEEPEIM